MISLLAHLTYFPVYDAARESPGSARPRHINTKQGRGKRKQRRQAFPNSMNDKMGDLYCILHHMHDAAWSKNSELIHIHYHFPCGNINEESTQTSVQLRRGEIQEAISRSEQHHLCTGRTSNPPPRIIIHNIQNIAPSISSPSEEFAIAHGRGSRPIMVSIDASTTYAHAY